MRVDPVIALSVSAHEAGLVKKSVHVGRPNTAPSGLELVNALAERLHPLMILPTVSQPWWRHKPATLSREFALMRT